MTTRSTELKLGIGGVGAIGLAVAKRIDAGDVPGISLEAVAVRDEQKARKALAAFRSAPHLTSLRRLGVEGVGPLHHATVAGGKQVLRIK